MYICVYICVDVQEQTLGRKEDDNGSGEPAPGEEKEEDHDDDDDDNDDGGDANNDSRCDETPASRRGTRLRWATLGTQFKWTEARVDSCQFTTKNIYMYILVCVSTSTPLD